MSVRHALICAAVVIPVVGLFYVAVVRQFREPEPVKPPWVEADQSTSHGDSLWWARIRRHRHGSRHRRGVRE